MSDALERLEQLTRRELSAVTARLRAEQKKLAVIRAADEKDEHQRIIEGLKGELLVLRDRLAKIRE